MPYMIKAVFKETGVQSKTILVIWRIQLPVAVLYRTASAFVIKFALGKKK
jgi:hypothetical protein